MEEQICKRCKKPITSVSRVCGCPMYYRHLLQAEIYALYHYGKENLHLPIILSGFKMFREERRAMEMITND